MDGVGRPGPGNGYYLFNLQIAIMQVMSIRVVASVIAFVGVAFLCACQPDKPQPAVTEAIEQHVFVVNIISDSVKLNEYLAYHRKVWPEVEAGFKAAGYRKIVLYRYGHLVVMTVDVPRGANLAEMGKKAEAVSPRCAEWNQLMGGYQQGVSGTPAGSTWVEVTPFYRFSDSLP